MKIALLDGNSFCYRAFYAIRDLRNSRGEPTNAVYGFITMLEKLAKDIKPDGTAIMFDLKGPTHRHLKYEEYKIHRKPMPDELVSQIPLIKDVLRAMNVPIFEKDGFEADDVIATLARKLEAGGHEVVIVTGDKDMLQLVSKKTKVLNPQKDNFLYDEAAVKARFGVGPKCVVEIMALMGDSSDNIPGVPGIGDKTAGKLIAEYGSLEAVYKNIQKIPGEKVKQSLITHKDQAWLSRELALIDREVPIEADLDALKRREPDYERLAGLYRDLEFRTLLKNLPAAVTKAADEKDLHYHLITDRGRFEEFVSRLSKKKEWAFDFETTGVDALHCQPIGISFSFDEKEATYVCFHRPAGRLDAGACLGLLKDLFEDPRIRKIGQNLKYEAMVLKNYGIDLRGIWFDTMVASYCLNPAKPNHNLDDIAMEHLGLKIVPIQELIGKGKGAITMDAVELERVYRYGCQDSDITFRLAKVLREKLEKKDMWGLFTEIEMPLVGILADMETAGIVIDVKLLEEFSGEMDGRLTGLTKRIYKLADAEFNINSTRQLSEILFEKLKLPVVKKTKTGASTDVEVLKELAEIHALPKELLKFRELSKLKSTYVDALPGIADPETHRVHTSFNQTVTATGRLSSSDPNLQNIPVRTEEGRKIRRAFVAESGRGLVSADYSQIELRVLAHLSEDKNLTAAFQAGEDIHRYTASLIFNVDLAAVTQTMRDSAKTVNFGVLYGMGPFSLAKGLNITADAAKDFIKAYFDRYPRVKRYLDETLEKARKDGFVSTVFNRRRYIPEIRSTDPRVRSFAERVAINAPIQGTASDIIKIAMRRVHEELEKGAYESRMILQVHDELLFEAPRDETDELAGLVRREMCKAVSFRVPMDVQVKIGNNWLDMKPAA